MKLQRAHAVARNQTLELAINSVHDFDRLIKARFQLFFLGLQLDDFFQKILFRLSKKALANEASVHMIGEIQALLDNSTRRHQH